MFKFIKNLINDFKKKPIVLDEISPGELDGPQIPTELVEHMQDPILKLLDMHCCKCDLQLGMPLYIGDGKDYPVCLNCWNRFASEMREARFKIESQRAAAKREALENSVDITLDGRETKLLIRILEKTVKELMPRPAHECSPHISVYSAPTEHCGGCGSYGFGSHYDPSCNERRPGRPIEHLDTCYYVMAQDMLRLIKLEFESACKDKAREPEKEIKDSVDHVEN